MEPCERPDGNQARRKENEMKLTSMEAPKSESNIATPNGDVFVDPSPTPKYAWGLKITLNTDSLNKLGIKIDDYKAGDKGGLSAKFVVEEVSSRDTDDGKENELCLQITDLGINPKDTRWSTQSSR